MEALGFEPPHPEQKQNKFNNRKIVFDETCRQILFDICRAHGLELEEEPKSGRKHLEKQDYIVMKQNEEIQKQEEYLEELTIKIEDVESFIDEVSEAAYDSAVETVTDAVSVAIHEQDIQQIRETQDWLNAPERNASEKVRNYAIARLDGLIHKLQNTMQSTIQKVKTWLKSPEVKQAGKEEVKKKARESIHERMRRARSQIELGKRTSKELEQTQKTKKQNIEI